MPDYESVGWRFESSLTHHIGGKISPDFTFIISNPNTPFLKTLAPLREFLVFCNNKEIDKSIFDLGPHRLPLFLLYYVVKLLVMNELEKIVNYEFKNKELLERALTHSSRANELGEDHLACNERLEFLGDAVLEEIMSVYLFDRLKDKTEGELTKIRAAIVCESTLAAVSKEFGLNRFLLLGNGEEHMGGRERPSILGDGIEAIIGAVFLDGGQEAAKNLIFKLLSDKIEDAVAGKLVKDSKSLLQEKAQEKGMVVSYQIVHESGPAHDKHFTSKVYLSGKEYGTGDGKSKKQAEVAAANVALKILMSEENNVL